MMTRFVRPFAYLLAALTLCVSLWSFQPLHTLAAPLTVNSCADSGVSGDGSLRGEILAAASGDTITFGVDCSTGPITLTGGTLTLGKNLTVDGSGHTVVVDGGCTGCGPGGTPSGGVQVFSVKGGVTAAILNLTIQHGHNAVGSASGGGIENHGALTLTNVVVSNNVATPIPGKNTGFGGGIFSQATLNATNVTISDNTAAGAAGGGIAASFGTTTLTDSTVSGNTSTSTGGGIYNDRNTLILTNVTISGNTTPFTDGGGGIRHEGSRTATLTNVTVSGNTAPATPGTGGGISVVNPAVLNATRTIVAGNSNGDLSGNGINGTNVNNLTSSNPLLAPLGAYGGTTATRPPLPGSPATDAGGTGCTGTDQRGFARPVNGACDIGAVESQGFSLTISGGNNQSAVVNQLFTSPLAVTVAPNHAGDPVNGGVISFAAPASGASATLSAGTATIASGWASVTATANGTAGGPYSVTASASGAASASFSLTNLPVPLTGIAITCAGSAAPRIKVGQMVTCVAMGTYADGSRQQLPAGQATWSGDNAQVAAMEPTTGKVTGESPGTIHLTATDGGVAQTIVVTVGGPTPIGIAVQPAPAGRPGGASTSGAGSPAPAAVPTGR